MRSAISGRATQTRKSVCLWWSDRASGNLEEELGQLKSKASALEPDEPSIMMSDIRELACINRLPIVIKM